MPCRSGSADVIGIRPAEREQGLMPLLRGGCQVVLQLPPLVARQVGMDQVIPLQPEPHVAPANPLIAQLDERRRETQLRRQRIVRDLATTPQLATAILALSKRRDSATSAP